MPEIELLRNVGLFLKWRFGCFKVYSCYEMAILCKLCKKWQFLSTLIGLTECWWGDLTHKNHISCEFFKKNVVSKSRLWKLVWWCNIVRFWINLCIFAGWLIRMWNLIKGWLKSTCNYMITAPVKIFYLIKGNWKLLLTS